MRKPEEFEPVVAEILLDPQIRQACAPYIQSWHFQRTIYKHLIEAITHKDFLDRPIDIKVLRLYMQSNYKDIYADDWRIIEDLFKHYSPVQSEDVEAVTKIVTNFVKSRCFLKGIDLYSKGDEKEAERFFSKASSFNILPDPFVDPLQDGIIEYLRLKDLPQGGNVIRSSLGVINRSLLYKGYKNGDLVMVVMRPKCGKSTFMVQEAAVAVDQGFKVAHMFFGDFSEYDGLCKFMSCVTGELLSNVVNAPLMFQKRCEGWLKNWRVAAFPAGSLDTNEIISYAKNFRKKFPFDMLVLDYDSNIRPPEDAGMYETGGVMYSAFKGFGQQENSVVMIGSQPKIAFWDDEVLNQASAAESSRKQHVVDVMITAGRNPKCKKVGTVHLPLVRRGESAVISRLKFDDFHSRISEIAQLEYDDLLKDHNNSHKDQDGDYIIEGLAFGEKPKGQ